jgi:hypothetical protein
LTLGPGVYAGHFIWAVADDEGGLVGRHPECDETNNFLDTGLALNEAPVVNAGVDRTITYPQMSVALQGSVTDDGVPAGVGLSIHWTKVSGPGLALFANPSAPGTSVTFTRGGVYVLRLVAGDSVLVAADDVTITVTVPNQAPDVSAGPDALLPNSATSYALFGAVTDDGLPSGASVVTTWTQRSGPATVAFSDASATTTSVTLPATGAYVLRLTASDTLLQAFDDVEVIRTPPNSAPVVSAGADQRIELPAHTATLVGAVTDDGLPLDAQRSYSWTVVSGPGAVLFSAPAALSTQATFGAAGTYVLRLSASDTQLTGSDDVTVVLLPPNQAPTVDARPDRQIQSDELLTIEGAVNDDGLPLPSSLTVAWSKVSGPGNVFFSSPAQATTSVQFDRAGSYTLRLTANDGVLSGSDDVTINVLAGNLPPVVSAGPDRTLQLPSSLLTLVGMRPTTACRQAEPSLYCGRESLARVP